MEMEVGWCDECRRRWCGWKWRLGGVMMWGKVVWVEIEIRWCHESVGKGGVMEMEDEVMENVKWNGSDGDKLFGTL